MPAEVVSTMKPNWRDGSRLIFILTNLEVRKLVSLLVWCNHTNPITQIVLFQVFLAAAAAAAKSHQSCPTLCNPKDCSPPGSPVPGILQARTLEWVAIAFSKPKLRIPKISMIFDSRWLSSKEFICQCRRHGFSPWVGKIPWRRKWQPTLGFMLGNGGPWQATDHGVTNSWI